MIEFLNEDRKKFKEYLIDFFHNAYNSDKLSSKDEIVNFDFLKSYGFCVKLSYGKGTISKIPWIIFIRTDTQEYKASYGVYVYCGIKRENGEIIVCIGESEDKTINYLAKNKVDDYNTQFNKKTYDYKNLNNDIDLIIDKIVENMQWFAKLPLNEIQDRNDLSKSNNKEIRNDGSEMSNKKENKNLSLNQILYGPPGTGKTYHTIDKALEILGENLESRDRDEKKAKFDEYVKDGQIVFTTFHQSYGYEEFVEGIKPKVDKKELEYEVQSGIFKKICEKALNNLNKEIKNKLKELEINNKTNSVWKISLGEKIRKDTEFLQKYCFENNQIRIGWWDTEKITNNPFIDNFRSMKIGDLVCVFDTISTIKAVGVVKSKVKYSKNEEFEKEYSFDLEEYQTYREVEWILKDKIIDILQLNNKTLDQKTVYQLKNISVSNLIKTIKDNLKDKFIIIIDEINRGNISKIFGELITLIEPSKRIGADEELKVTLPYSKEEFGVPQNVYILGTMNTADRSITALDTALRRRFEFIEMMPDVSKLSDNYKDVNLQELLKAINTRIEYLLDREKTIGHAFFIGVENLEDLKKVFQNKIIPLLQEYFYNDYALISAVLNDNGMIKKCEKDDKYLQKIKNLDNVDSEKIIYNIASFDNEIWNDIKTYQAIYNDGENQSKNDKQ
ncbi:TPA: AAA family ATPase [Campylobacter coli]|nr:AAA family ATPase [Campylobacter coli]